MLAVTDFVVTIPVPTVFVLIGVGLAVVLIVKFILSFVTG